MPKTRAEIKFSLRLIEQVHYCFAAVKAVDAQPEISPVQSIAASLYMQKHG
jgi:hypothetical protein